MKSYLSILAVAASASAMAASLSGDFSITNGNPNGPWTYGSKATTLGAMTAFNTPSTGTNVSPAATFEVWSTSGNPLPIVYKLTSGTINGQNGGVGGVAVGEVSMHGSPSGELAVTRYTVGTTGLYNLSGFFKSGDALGNQYGNIDGYLLLNSTMLYSTLNTGVTQTFSLSSVSMTAGDTLDMMVGIGQDTHFYDTTPVDLTITLVPEPGSIAVLGLGALALMRRRRA